MMPRWRPNADLAVGAGHKQRWNQPAHRRYGFHHAHEMFRQSLAFRSGQTLCLSPATNEETSRSPALAALIENRAFSACVVARGEALLFEVYADDFPARQPHSIQSITKTLVHQMLGQAAASGAVDLAGPVSRYLPGIGSGYAGASVQAVADMAVANAYTEDYEDPLSDAYLYEVALGWRLPEPGQHDMRIRDYVAGIGGGRPCDPTSVDYKSANTEVLAWLVETATGVPLRAQIAAIADAAGFEGTFHISCDRDGVPALSGGGCLCARDLARLGLLYARVHAGTASVGDAAFTASSLTREAPRFAPPRSHIRYANQLFTNGRWLGHGGYGGQFLMVDPQTATVAAFLSVLENDSGYDESYIAGVVNALDAVVTAAAGK